MELDNAGVTVERPGLAAVAVALVAILDEPKHVAAQPGPHVSWWRF
ncbi:hypothetical protein [Mycobacterium sp. 23]